MTGTRLTDAELPTSDNSQLSHVRAEQQWAYSLERHNSEDPDVDGRITLL